MLSPLLFQEREAHEHRRGGRLRHGQKSTEEAGPEDGGSGEVLGGAAQSPVRPQLPASAPAHLPTATAVRKTQVSASPRKEIGRGRRATAAERPAGILQASFRQLALAQPRRKHRTTGAEGTGFSFGRGRPHQ